MSLRLVIWDFDDTLVDSAHLADVRRNGSWRGNRDLLESAKPFPLISKLICCIHNAGVKQAVVSTAPRDYVEAIVRQWGWKVLNNVVGYHDARPKPSPDPVIKCLAKSKIRAIDAIMIGDSSTDRDSAAAAGVQFLQAGWSVGASRIVDCAKFLQQPFQLIPILRSRDAYMRIH